MYVHLRMLIKKTPISTVGKEREDGSNINVEVAGPSILVACLGAWLASNNLAF